MALAARGRSLRSLVCHMLHFEIETLPHISGSQRSARAGGRRREGRVAQNARTVGSRCAHYGGGPGVEDLPVRLVRRRFRASDLANALLVFAATDDRLTNHRIAIAAKGRGQFANIADSAEECGFLVPARVHRGEVQIAVSTGGESPRLTAELRKKLEEIL